MSRGLATTALVACALSLAACGTDATEDNVIDSVPADARAYLHLDRESDDWSEAREALQRLPAVEGSVLELLDRSVGNVPGDGEAGVALLPGQRRPTVVSLDDPEARFSLDALDDYRTLLDGLPEQRFVHGYLGRRAAAPLRELDSSIVSTAAAADLDGDVMHVRVRTRHEAEAGRCSSGVAGDDLLDIADPGAALYLEVPSIACAIRAVASRAGGGGAALRQFARAARRQGGVSFQKELLPFLDRRGAVIASPGKLTPTITLIVDGVDETEALDLFARLQPVLIHLVQSEELGQAPSFGSAEVAGITAATAQLAPGLELSYAAWDDRLVISTSLDGIRQVRRAEGLAGSDAFESVLEDRPSESSALLFLDLDQLLALGEQAGLAEDPRYLAVRDDLQKLRAAGAVLSREENFTTAELTFQIP